MSNWLDWSTKMEKAGEDFWNRNFITRICHVSRTNLLERGTGWVEEVLRSWCSGADASMEGVLEMHPIRRLGAPVWKHALGGPVGVRWRSGACVCAGLLWTPHVVRWLAEMSRGSAWCLGSGLGLAWVVLWLNLIASMILLHGSVYYFYKYYYNIL